MATKYVTVAGAGSKTGADWDNAYGLAEWVSFMTGSASSGDIIYVAGGTYTLTGNLSANRSGQDGNGINCIGVVSGTTAEPPTSADYADGTDRPLIDAGSYSVGHAMYWMWRNFRFTLNTSLGISPGASVIFANCLINNAASSCYGVTISYSGYPHYFFDTEITCSSGGGINAGDRVMINNCYLHDFTGHAVNSTMDPITVIDSIIDTCNSGIVLAAGSNLIMGNTFYGCTTAVNGGTYGNNIIVNNAVCSCTDGLKFSSAVNQFVVDYNNYYGNTTDVTNITKGGNALAVDPGFTDAAGGDFSLESTSGMIGQGFKTRLGVS